MVLEIVPFPFLQPKQDLQVTFNTLPTVVDTKDYYPNIFQLVILSKHLQTFLLPSILYNLSIGQHQECNPYHFIQVHF
jgi:hypothetical protein